MSIKKMAFRGVTFGFNAVCRYKRLPTINSTNITRTFASATYNNIITEKKGEKQNVGLITLNRPKVLNALCAELINELVDALQDMEEDESIGAIVITGNDKAFAAGADIKEMMNQTYAKNHRRRLLENWTDFAKYQKPVIAAVNGYALGGGCELALGCDIIYAGDTATFGQPEITVGTIPGAGGSQRIARSCGKSKAMEMCLSANQFSAQEAEKMGLISKVVPANQTVDEAIKLGEKISSFSPIIVKLCKEAVNVAFETSLQQGIRFERSHYFGTFATADRKEGMSSFAEKRKPNFKNE